MKYSLLGIALIITILAACSSKQQEGQGSNMAPPSGGDQGAATHNEHPTQPNPSEGSSGE